MATISFRRMGCGDCCCFPAAEEYGFGVGATELISHVDFLCFALRVEVTDLGSEEPAATDSVN